LCLLFFLSLCLTLARLSRTFSPPPPPPHSVAPHYVSLAASALQALNPPPAVYTCPPPPGFPAFPLFLLFLFFLLLLLLLLPSPISLALLLTLTDSFASPLPAKLSIIHFIHSSHLSGVAVFVLFVSSLLLLS